VATLPHPHGSRMHFRAWLPCLAAVILNHPIYWVFKWKVDQVGYDFLMIEEKEKEMMPSLTNVSYILRV
jgi:hypothetical protein